MNKFEFELNEEGIKDLLKSSDINAICEECAQEVLNRLGDGYAKNSHIGTTRINVSIGAVTDEAAQDNRENNRMEKVLNSMYD